MSINVYHFSSPTCAPCKQIKPAIDDIQEEFSSKIQWISVNTHDDPNNYALKMGVTVVPTMVVVTTNSDGMPILTDKHSGTVIMGYYRIIRRAIQALSR
jgi:thioredoxin-like negative regulator of GroEL